MLNKCILMGRLVADPELRRTQTDLSVTSFTIAVERDFKDRASGEKQTDFIDCVAWRQTAEFISKWFTKGMLVAVSGRLQTRMWEDKQGQKRKSVEVQVDDAYFAEGKKDSSNSPRQTQQTAPAPFDMGGDFGDNEFSELEMDDGELPF